MTRERWDELIGQIKDDYRVTNDGQQPLEEEPGTSDFIEFTGPTGEVRLELITRPLVLGKKTFGGRKIGTAAGVQYQYSPDEVTLTLKAWRRQDGEWTEIDPAAFR